MNNNPIKCDICGKFIAYKDIPTKTNTYYTPETEYSTEKIEFVHLKCETNITKRQQSSGKTIIVSCIDPSLVR